MNEIEKRTDSRKHLLALHVVALYCLARLSHFDLGLANMVSWLQHVLAPRPGFYTVVAYRVLIQYA